jgi:outer membrane protein
MGTRRILLILFSAVLIGAGGTSTPKRYTFKEALESALARNPTALIAKQEILRAEALIREARASSLPTLTGNVVGTRIDNERKLNDRVIQGAESISANVALNVPLIVPQRWMQWLHASDNAEISRVSALDVGRSLSIGAARAYLAVVAQRRVLDVSQRAFKTAQAHFEFAHKRREGGVGKRLDEVRAQQEEETTRAQVAMAQAALSKAQEALGVLLAEDGPADAADELVLPEPPPLDDALADAADRRSDLKVIESRRVAARHQVRDGYADYLPSLFGLFQPFYQNPSTLTQPETGWQAQLILSIPFYDGGFRYGAKHEREAIEEEMRVSLEGAKRQVQADVRSSFETLIHADEALLASRRSAALAAETLELANQAYAAGAITNLEVIDAERSARDAETAAAAAEDNARQARLDFLATSGRFP